MPTLLTKLRQLLAAPLATLGGNGTHFTGIDGNIAIMIISSVLSPIHSVLQDNSDALIYRY